MEHVFWMWCVIMHVAVLWGVLDVNFHSPILRGLPSIPPPSGAPAKRLLLFVADGLRFRTFIENPPLYLTEIMNKRGTWGMSRTRVPTESRPGHVALAAGLYEDPSALFKGWKENPVDFDSVFNQSRFAWAWGSPDIVPMFVKGSENKVYGKTYPAEWQDFGGESESITRLDSWVFEQFNEWMNQTAEQIKNSDGIVLFFHLLGCDTAGHAKKPHSKEYQGCYKYVDQEIRRVARKIEEYYHDNRTAYMFTSDHGMTNWGSHGSGSTDETETPLVVWGAGVNDKAQRVDVEQADVAPLIAALLGIPVPVNNEGILARNYLKADNKDYMVRALLSNIKQLELQIRGNRILSHGTDTETETEIQLKSRIRQLERLLEFENLDEAIEECEDVMLLAKKALVYFREYHRDRLMFYLTIAWIGWITSLFLKITGITRHRRNRMLLVLADICFACISLGLLFTSKGLTVLRLPGYAFLALISFWQAFRNALCTSPFLRGCWIWMAATIVLLMMMAFGLSARWVFGLATLCLCVMQKLLFERAHHLLCWTAIILAVFPLLPVVGPEPRIYLVLLSLGITGTLLYTSDCRIPNYLKSIEGIRLLSTAVVHLGWIDGRQFLSWIILTSTPICVCAHPEGAKERILGVALAFFSPFALLSSSYEPLFLIVLVIHLLCWPSLSDRYKLMNHEGTTLSIEDFTEAAFFMLYALLGFFGTGNMASISSFDPSWTRHFLTVFSPFTMCSLILLKLSIPLLIIGCATRTLAPPTLFLATLLLGDCLTLPVMYAVTPRGSWLDIGTAISRFVIAITFPCFLLLLYHLSYPLVTYSITRLHVPREPKQHV